jgi:N-acetylglucosaminyldiphosphoundecaprenol N-acetyl-beta-D-mannosaminyltransferase
MFEHKDAQSAHRSDSHLEILGCCVSRVTLAEATDRIEGWIRKPIGRPRYIVATGFHGIWEAHKDPALRQILNSADLLCPDGIAPVWLSRAYGKPLQGRVPGPDLMAAFLARANSSGYSSFFFGDTDETLAALKKSVEAKYPGHRVAGLISPPFTELCAEEDQRLLDQINQAKPDILWVGLGMPKQEWWIHNHIDRLQVSAVVGVGAAFRFLSGEVKRAPRWIGERGFEWLWRLAMEPSKLWRRDLIDGPRFLGHALLECIDLKRKSIASSFSRNDRR